MKTCSYNGAQPCLVEGNRAEGIFARQSPRARHSFLPCRRAQCRCCGERRDLTGRFEPAVQFSSAHAYRFLNGYEVILNCPATCTTSNVVYALTCVCHAFEYIGETRRPFCDRLHRQCFIVAEHRFPSRSFSSRSPSAWHTYHA